MRELIRPNSLPPPTLRYSAVVKAGPHYYCSGLVAVDPASGKLLGEGAGEQADRILANLRLLMEDLGLGFEQLVMARIFTTRMDRFADINAAWEAVFSPGVEPPARTSVGVAALPLGAEVEMEFTFYKP